MLQSIMHLPLRLPPLLILQHLQISLRIQPIHLRIIPRDIHLLHAPQIRVSILVETAGDERTRGICAGEEVVGAVGAVVATPGRDVVDGAVDGEEDGEGFVGAVVMGEVGVGVGFGSCL
jgi:hypothetical protein